VAVAGALSLSAVRPGPSEKKTHVLDFRPVLANRSAMGYVLGYGVHCWELFTLRSWLVALLAFNLLSQPAIPYGWPSPTSVAMLSGLVAMFASVAGNELCIRFGRPNVIRLIMISSAAMACVIGFASSLPYGALVALALFYSALVQFDSAALTAGAIAAADPNRQGATMAVHSLFGFGCACIGPLVVGVVLDLSGGANTSLSWGLAFLSVGLIGVFGPLALRMAATGVTEDR
jgi:MFS family permease